MLKSRLQEFGFVDAGRFPRKLKDHAVTLSLPSAMDRGLQPVGVFIERGLLVPLQKAGSANGMIIRDDGMMLYVGHSDPKDESSSLGVRFIQDIPYDVRVEVSNVMRKALPADPSLEDIWGSVRRAWMAWYPPTDGEAGLRRAGEFTSVTLAWQGVVRLLSRLVDGIHRKASGTVAVAVKVVLQSESEFVQGWMGEEIAVDEADLKSGPASSVGEHVRQVLFPKMAQALKAPVFHPRSSFRLFYETRSAHVIRLVVVPPSDALMSLASSVGIELSRSALDAKEPEQESRNV